MWKTSTIILHWLSAVLIIGTIITIKSAHNFSFDDARPLYIIHIIAGGIIAILTISRIYIRFKNRKKSPQSNKLAKIAHKGIYVFLIFIITTGFIGAIDSNSFLVVFEQQGKITPTLTLTVHHLAGNLLILIILLHTTAGLYHLFKKGDKTFSRMLGTK